MLVKKGILWHCETDIAVVGFGGAGAVAAITACDEGAQVLVLEKQPAATHMNNTSMSGGGFISTKDVPALTNYMKQLNRTDLNLMWTEPDVMQTWAEYASHNVEWVKQIGGHLKLVRSGGEHHQIPGYESIEIYQSVGKGYGLMKLLKENVEHRQIRLIYDTAVRKLLTNSSGEVIGVSAEKNGQPVNIRASRAVVLTLGGFEFDEEMKLNYLRVYPSFFYGSPANTGDGIRMVQEVGASLWHMNCCSARMVAKFPEFPIAFTLDFGGRGLTNHNNYAVEGDPCSYIVVDKNGRRFTNEADVKGHTLYYELAVYDSHRLTYPRVPSYMIFDVKRMQAGPLPIMSGPTGAHQVYKWNKNNQKELDKGWIIQADTIRELARKLEVEPANLQETVQRYNTYHEKGSDPEFSRARQHLKPLVEPPFFAVKLWPGGPNTQGGPRRNWKAQVLNVDNQPIPRLYAAGEFGSIFGMLYPSAGGNISECIAFGRIAGQNAASEKPR